VSSIAIAVWLAESAWLRVFGFVYVAAVSPGGIDMSVLLGGRYKDAGGLGGGFGELDITAFSVIDSWLFRLQCILS